MCHEAWKFGFYRTICYTQNWLCVKIKIGMVAPGTDIYNCHKIIGGLQKGGSKNPPPYHFYVQKVVHFCISGFSKLTLNLNKLYIWNGKTSVAFSG